MLEQVSFQKFINLISFDKKIRLLEKEVQILIKDSLIIDDEKKNILNSLKIIDLHVHDLKKEVDAKELEMKTLEIKENELKAHLEQIRHTDEYYALKRETDALKKQQHDYEDALLYAWAVYEAAQKEVVQKRVDFDAKIKELTIKQQEQKDKKSNLDRLIIEITAERKALEDGIPELWLEQYMRKRSIVDDPVVPIVSESCSVCFYYLSPQDYIFLKKNRFLQCKECYRLLYQEVA